MSLPEFLSPHATRPRLEFRPDARSPLARVLAEPRLGLRDVSLAYGKVEVRGELGDLGVPGAEEVRISPTRALLLCPYERTPALLATVEGRFRLALDVTGALAGLEVGGPDPAALMRRLTALDLDALPAAGSVARIQAIVRRTRAGFELFCAQEYGHYLAEVAIDQAEGLGWR